MTLSTHPPSVLVDELDGGWHCDCVCGWTSSRLRLTKRVSADRVASMHVRVCTLLHPSRAHMTG